MNTYQDDLVLYHHGIKGQKWGVRRYQNEDGSLTAKGKARYAENYSEEQRVRDRKIYGRGAERRINKRMLEGESIQSARHNEVVRKERIDSAKAVGRTVAKGALVVGGTIGITMYLSKKGWLNSPVAGVATETTINAGKHIINALIR